MKMMVEVYYKLIKANKRTIDEVPIDIRQDVQTLIDNEVQNNGTI